MPYSAMPQRPASKRVSGSRRVPAEFARCRTHGGKASATRANARTCWRANAVSVSSAVARWLIRPQSRGPGVLRASASVRPTARAASGSRPQRPMPVSTLTCTPRSVRSRTRAHTSSVPTTTSSPPASRSSPGASGPMTMILASGSASRSARASPSVATQSASAPSSSATRPTSTAPWPYPSALTTAKSARGPSASRSRRTLARTAPSSMTTRERSVNGCRTRSARGRARRRPG